MLDLTAVSNAFGTAEVLAALAAMATVLIAPKAIKWGYRTVMSFIPRSS